MSFCQSCRDKKINLDPTEELRLLRERIAELEAFATPEKIKTLFELAKKGGAERMRHILNKFNSEQLKWMFDKKDENGETLLAIAQQNKREEVQEILLEKGARPNEGDDSGTLPGSSSGSLGCDKTPAQKSAAEEQQLGVSRKRAAVQLVAGEGRAEKRRKLEEGGVDSLDLDEKIEKLFQLVGSGVEHGEKEGAKADDEEGDKDGDEEGQVRRVLEVCSENESAHLLRAMRNGYTLLAMAAKKGKEKVAKFLLERGASPSEFAVENRGTTLSATPLQIAAGAGHSGVCSVLIRNLANVDDQQKRMQLGQNALHLAASNGHMSVVDLLLENNATIELIDSVGDTALMKALSGKSENHTRTAQMLLAKGAKCNFANYEGWAALHLAAANDNVELCKEILKRDGVSVNMMTRQRGSPLHVASERGSSLVVDFLLENNPEIELEDSIGDTALLKAVTHGQQFIVNKLLV